MKKTNVTYGVIGGIIVSAWMVVWWMLESSGNGPDVNNNQGFIIGLLTMLIGFTTIVLANRNVAKQTDGVLKFWTLFRSGLIITSVATLIYVACWLIIYENGGDAWMENMQAEEISRIEATEMPDGKKEVTISESKKFMKLYDESILVRAGVTITEIFPLGLLIAAISALVFRRKG